MTAREVMEAWKRFPKLGRISFLLKSGYMREAYPEDNEQFIQSLDHLAVAEFVELPGELQIEFSLYVETPIFQIWTKRGGDVSEEADHLFEVQREIDGLVEGRPPGREGD